MHSPRQIAIVTAHSLQNTVLLDEVKRQLLEWQKELTELLERLKESENPSYQWSFVFSQYLTKIFVYFLKQEGKTAENIQFAFCLSGAHVQGIGSPHCSLEGFVLVENPDDVATLERIMMRFQQALLKIANNAQCKLFGFTDKATVLPVFCGTKIQLLDKLNKSESGIAVSNIVSSVSLFGKVSILSDLQKNIDQSYLFRNNTFYHHLSSYLYDQGITVYIGPKSTDKINIYNDIIVPTLYILDGLRYEVGVTHSTTLKEVISILISKDHLSQAVADTFLYIINTASKMRWTAHCHANKVKDTIKLNSKNHVTIKQLIEAVAMLRRLASERIKRSRNTVNLKEKRTSRLDFDKNNPSPTSPLSSHKTQAQLILNVTDIMRAYIEFHSEYFQIKGGNDIQANASRLFNNVEVPKHFTHYVGSFFQCLHKGTVDKNKFNSWIWAAIRRCSHDILDEKGRLKSYIQECLNKEHWYSNSAKQIGQDKLDKFILFSYFMNALFAGVINDTRYIKANADSIQISPDNPLMRQIQLQTADFFNINIYKKLNLASLQDANYYSALFGEAACLKSLSQKISNIVKKNISRAEKNLYTHFLNDKHNNETIENIMLSLDQFLASCAKSHKVTQQQFHEYDTRINAMLDCFIKEVLLLLTQIKSRFLLQFFNFEGCELDSMHTFLVKTKQQLTFFAQEAVTIPQAFSLKESCSIS